MSEFGLAHDVGIDIALADTSPCRFEFERRQGEEWPGRSLHRMGNGNYAVPSVQNRWEEWQVAWNRSEAQSEAERSQSAFALIAGLCLVVFVVAYTIGYFVGGGR